VELYLHSSNTPSWRGHTGTTLPLPTQRQINYHKLISHYKQETQTDVYFIQKTRKVKTSGSLKGCRPPFPFGGGGAKTGILKFPLCLRLPMMQTSTLGCNAGCKQPRHNTPTRRFTIEQHDHKLGVRFFEGSILHKHERFNCLGVSLPSFRQTRTSDKHRCKKEIKITINTVEDTQT
jgi:hypothetical protein